MPGSGYYEGRYAFVWLRDGARDHWMDPNLADFLHLGFRFYEPEVGRFSQLDPIRDGMNWYAYVEGNPQIWVDPTGLIKFCLPTKHWRNLKFKKRVHAGTTWCPIPAPDPRPGWPLLFVGVAKYLTYYDGERKYVCRDTRIFCRGRTRRWEEWRKREKVETEYIGVHGPLPDGEGTPIDQP